MKWLVTGGVGFIGANLVHRLLETGERAISLDLEAAPAGWPVEHIQADVCTPPRLEVDVVVHLAAVSGVPACHESPDWSFRTNVWGTVRLLEGVQAPRFIFASSGAAATASTVYGGQKAAAEALVRGHSQARGFDAGILRFSNVYGPYSRQKTSAVHAFCRSIVAGQKPVVHGDGSFRRDFIYVQDVCDAIIAAGSNREPIRSLVVQVCTGRTSSLNDVVRLLGAETRFGGVPWGDSTVVTDPSVARDLLGWEAEVELSRGLELTLDWYRSLG